MYDTVVILGLSAESTTHEGLSCYIEDEIHTIWMNDDNDFVDISVFVLEI